MISEMNAAADLMRQTEEGRVAEPDLMSGTLVKPVASVLDLGSSSVKLSHYMVDAHNDFKLYYRRSIRLNLFEGLLDGIIRPEYVNRTVQTLKLFREQTDFEGTKHVVAIATSAVRDADNQSDVIDRILRETGFEFLVLSDREEACYSYTGAIRMLHIPSALFFDIGGGSLEVVVAKNYNIKTALSLPLGALRLTQKFATDSGYRNVDFDAMGDHIESILPAPRDIGIKSRDVLATGDGRSGFAVVGVGGALRSLAKYVQEKNRYPLSKIHNYSLSVGALEEIWSKIREMPPERIAKIPAISSGRADTIRAAILVILMFMKRMGIDAITVSAHGLREGALALSMRHPEPFKSRNIDESHIRDTVLSVISPAANLVSTRVESLVDMLMTMGLLRHTDRPILHYALEQTDRLRMFRDISNITYMIMDDDTTLSHGDQFFAALAVMHTRKHRKADMGILNFESVTGPHDKKYIRRLSAIISLYTILDRSPARMIPKMDRGGSITLSVTPEGKKFPRLMFKEVCEQMGSAFGIPFTGSVGSSS